MKRIKSIEKQIKGLQKYIDNIYNQGYELDYDDIEAIDSAYVEIDRLKKEKADILKKRKEAQRLREMDTIGARARFGRL